jgi:hypothetical protein
MHVHIQVEHSSIPFSFGNQFAFILHVFHKTSIWVECHNPSFGFTTKAKGLQRCGPRESPGVTSHTPGSVGKCEGVNPQTPKATPTLGDGVPVDS